MGIARVGLDKAGGNILGPGEPTVTIGGYPVAVVGDKVARHLSGIHVLDPTLTQGSDTIFAGGKPVVMHGMKASCGHDVTPGDTT